MSPRLVSLLTPRRSESATTVDASFSDVRTQWRNPNDILTILMIIGGDIVQLALAALAGPAHPAFPIAPVAFSFGWVSYAFSAVLAAIGEGRLMPAPDCSVTLINVETLQSRTVSSWPLARLMRDYEPPLPDSPADRDLYDPARGLTICFLTTDEHFRTGVPSPDWVYVSGIVTIVLQLGIAAIPGALVGNWMILIITAGATLLCLLTTALPAWTTEKWSARALLPGKHEFVCLTRGNGTPLVLVVRSDGCGLKLEDLAGGRIPTSRSRARFTIQATAMLALLWLVHLITVESIQSCAWHSLAVGALGMLQNGIAAGARRTPAALGFHFSKERKVVYDEKVCKALQKAEGVQTGVGTALLPVFFPGGLRADEERCRHGVVREHGRQEEKKREQGVVSPHSDEPASSNERYSDKVSSTSGSYQAEDEEQESTLDRMAPRPDKTALDLV